MQLALWTRLCLGRDLDLDLRAGIGKMQLFEQRRALLMHDLCLAVEPVTSTSGLASSVKIGE